MSSTRKITLATGVILLVACQGAQAALMENFDDVSTTPYSLTNTTGGAPAIINDGGGTNNAIRLTNLNASNNNSIAFDEEPSATGPTVYGIRLAFDFRMTDDAANAAAGGCCGSAADGLGIGVFLTGTYGTTGGINPADGSGVDWEQPHFPDAITVGLDIFQNIDVVTLNVLGVEAATLDVQPIMDLNNNTWHRMIIDVTPDGANALGSVTLLEDVDSNTTIHDILTDQAIPGLDLSALPGYRLIAGGRTGGAFADSRIDNIFLGAVPEPTTVILLLAGGVSALGRRRRGLNRTGTGRSPRHA